MRVLLVSSRFPLPPWRGNQLRTLQWLDALDDCERVLACPVGAAEELPPELGTELVRIPAGRITAAAGAAAAFAARRPVQEGIYDTRAARRRLRELIDTLQPDAVVVQMVRCGWAADVAAAVSPAPKLIFDAIDCMSLHFGRAAPAAPLAMRPLYRMEARRCRQREGELVRRSSATAAVSRRDLEALGAGSRGRLVTVACGAEVSEAAGGALEPVILLSGNLGYAPTVRAAVRFAREVWPAVRRAVPAARWVVAGARPAAAVRSLAALPGVEVHGDVADLAPYLRRAAVAVAPMASGSGVPIKILEALAAGVPVVADPWSAAGLEDPTAVVVAGDSAAWVTALQQLLSDPEAALEQASRGRRVWREAYHPEVVRQQIRDLVVAAVERNPEPAER
ncbi:MAG: glycosyltransferase [Thermoanaerobaculales bacterium]|jgi:glycosyltransferase involved in cell wall biosynthesis|nr:glycosyltransferase [Thermoanaerobaculales bacterium]